MCNKAQFSKDFATGTCNYFLFNLADDSVFNDVHSHYAQGGVHKLIGTALIRTVCKVFVTYMSYAAMEKTAMHSNSGIYQDLNQQPTPCTRIKDVNQCVMLSLTEPKLAYLQV